MKRDEDPGPEGDDDSSPTADMRAEGMGGPPPLPPDEAHPRYTIERRIAKGGMASIYSVVDHQLHRVSAMKVLDVQYAAQARERQRFVEEAEITAQLDHPHIVPVHEL